MQKLLLKISLIISILGIFLLLIISNLVNPKSVSSYQELKLNEYVKTKGKIISMQKYDEFSIIKLDNNITITCNCNFQLNSTIEIIGKVQEYQSMLQIQAERIEILEK